ncbi:MAG: MBL fold metallo-hydrolase [Thermoanaerobaculia bacterium]|nr:MBL fold metallo-hydrolase [Thermoanaerobaculia bacterium]
MLGSFFQADPDLRLTVGDIYLDPSSPRALAIVSHAHSDHIGRHEHFVATPATAAIVRSRLGSSLSSTELPYRQTLELREHEVELFPAGHILGSAMTLVRRDGESLLYTGDFRLRPSWTAEEAEVPEADAVIMESTYGSPEWRFPSREELGERLLTLVSDIIGSGNVPVLLAYSLGKAQEVCSWLARHGVRVVVHPAIAKINDIYLKHGVDVGPFEVWAKQSGLFTQATTSLAGAAVIVPPHLDADIRAIPRRETVSLTGWCLKGGWRTGGDHALPLSDHADFEELIELVERARPRIVYVTHGSKSFARELRQRGFAAEFLKQKPQMRLF